MPESICNVPDCGRPSRLAGLCGAHHQRKLRHGDVRAHIPLKGTDTDPNAFWCSKCHQHKPKGDFYAETRSRRGVHGVCKACTRKRRQDRSSIIKANAKRRRIRDAEKIRLRKRADYLRTPPEVHRERSRAWRKANPDKVSAHIRAQNAARYARIKSAPGISAAAQIKARWDYYGGKCWMCGAEATDTDHVKPLAHGGSNWPSNLRPACRSCNRSKSAAWPYTVRRGGNAA